uniref:Uncharacterized protein n=1 Tax=Oryza meridionalis TaxID=40149 RepID=A0A0E0E8M4_9ORYZ
MEMSAAASVAVAPARAPSVATKIQTPDDAPPCRPPASVLSVAVSTFADFEPVFFSNVEPHPHAVKVLAVRELKHAPALLHLLESASSDHGCKIVGLRLVENLSKLDALLAVVSEGVIPLLLNDLRDPDANR